MTKWLFSFLTSVEVKPNKVGGSYGARITRNVPMTILCALAASKYNKPVRMFMDFNTNQMLIGKRVGYGVQYKIGTDNFGRIQAVQLTAYFNQVRAHTRTHTHLHAPSHTHSHVQFSMRARIHTHTHTKQHSQARTRTRAWIK